MFHLLIKPASSECNMRCSYCFYADESENRQIPSYGIMSEATMEALVQKSLQEASGQCTFAFQGGEPLLAGLPFFERFIEFQKKYNAKKVRIHNTIQTNGYCVDDAWADFFFKNNFLVGLSLDGPKEVNDINRMDVNGDSVYNTIMKTARLFDSHKVEYNILTVVSSHVAKNIGKVYGFFKRNGFSYQQYIPCLDPFLEKRGGYSHSLTPELYERFLFTLFDLWYRDVSRGQGVSIRFFDNLYGIVCGYPPESCGMLGFCACQYVVEADGGVYPCDFYVMDPYRLGNLNIDGFDDLEKRRVEIGFVEVSRHVDEECMQCPYANVCRGGCRRDREPMVNGVLSLNYYCIALKAFYAYALPKLSELRVSMLIR